MQAEDFADEILPVQFFAAPAVCSTPVGRLCVALLEDLFVARQFRRRYPHSQYWRAQAEADAAWLSGAPAAVSFATVCDLLGLSPAAVRAAYGAGPGNSRNGRHPGGRFAG